jgi:hypothetical protein
MQSPSSKSWVAPRLSDGLCNRLFQIVGAIYHANKWKRPLIFYIPKIQPSEHSDCSVIFKLFPEIPIVWFVPKHELVKELPQDCMKFAPLEEPISDDPTVLLGYFQNPKYFPEEGVLLDFINCIGEERAKQLQLPNAEQAWWIHVRLGDYRTLSHHSICDLDYYKKTLEMVPKGSFVYLFSDEPLIAKEMLKSCSNHMIVMVDTSINTVETLYLMSQVGGGCIGSNSTFSWWGQYLARQGDKKPICVLPSKWNKMIDADKTDIYAPWHTIIDVE